MYLSNKHRQIIKYIDLFCGLGAFHTAFDQLNIQNDSKFNYECVLACDIDVTVRTIYQENYGIIPLGDINSIDINTIPNFDLLCAGFPAYCRLQKSLFEFVVVLTVIGDTEI